MAPFSVILDGDANKSEPLEPALYQSSRVLDCDKRCLLHGAVVFSVGDSRTDSSERKGRRGEAEDRKPRERAEAAKAERESKEREQHQVVITEQDALELAAARHLILQKSFSWNRLISDLEQLVPKQARIAAIKVEGISDAGQGLTAKVLVKAIGATSAQMTEMMTSIEKSGGTFTINQADQDAVVETGEVPFTLELAYRAARGEAQ